MASPSTGNDYLLYVDSADADSSGDTRTYVLIGGQRTCSLERSLGNADSTDKDSLNWEENLPTNRAVAVSCDGVREEGDTGQDKIISIWENRRTQYYKAVTPGGTEYEFRANLENYNESAPQDDVVDFSMQLKITGALATL